MRLIRELRVLSRIVTRSRRSRLFLANSGCPRPSLRKKTSNAILFFYFDICDIYILMCKNSPANLTPRGEVVQSSKESKMQRELLSIRITRLLRIPAHIWRGLTFYLAVSLSPSLGKNCSYLKTTRTGKEDTYTRTHSQYKHMRTPHLHTYSQASD